MLCAPDGGQGAAMSKFDLTEVLTEKLLKRFWDKVDKHAPNGCWEWTAANSGGKRPYGQFFILNPDGSRQLYQAHRVSWLIQHGSIPSSNIDLCHKCDNPKCVNPSHLFLGSRKENMEDCKRKGRNSPPPVRRGERANSAKLTEKDVRYIRSRPKRYGLFTELAAVFDVDTRTIENIWYRRTWKHID